VTPVPTGMKRVSSSVIWLSIGRAGHNLAPSSLDSTHKKTRDNVLCSPIPKLNQCEDDIAWRITFVTAPRT